jgi:FlaA1/EpsC-like NDP-sugar epimerase
VVVIVAYTALLLLRFELDVPSAYWRRFGVFLAIAIVVHLVTNRLWGAYGQVWRHASIREARALLFAGASSAVLLLATFAWREDRVRYRSSWSGLLSPRFSWERLASNTACLPSAGQRAAPPGST